MTEPATTEPTDRRRVDSVGRPVDSSTVSVAGQTIAYAEYGDPVGQPVVLFHGTPGTHQLGGLFAPAATARGVRLLAFDRPGYGDSEPWPERSLPDIGTVVAGVLDAAGVDSAGLIGFSGGGPHALAVAATHGNRVRRVDVISGSTPPDIGDQPPPVQRLLSGMAERMPRLVRGLFSGHAWIAARHSPSLFLSQYTDRDLDSFDEAVVDQLTAEFVAAVGGSRPGVATEFRLLGTKWGILIDKIEQPVGFWHGTRDTNVRLTGVQQLSQRLPNSRLTTVTGDHLSTLVDCRARVVACHS